MSLEANWLYPVIKYNKKRFCTLYYNVEVFEHFLQMSRNIKKKLTN